MQQRTEQDLRGRELIGYSYAIEEGGIPEDPEDIVKLGAQFFPFWKKHADVMEGWLTLELLSRINPGSHLDRPTEELHPALQTTFEGNWPSYTYTERLMGMEDSIVTALENNPDTRRAYWPIYRPEDAVRASAPTRVPCSLGYEYLIRQTRHGQRMLVYYLERSADFDTFFLSDIWLAHMLRNYIAERVNMPAGQFFHTIISLHSFAVEGMEIY